jgi:hypothetical protein
MSKVTTVVVSRHQASSFGRSESYSVLQSGAHSSRLGRLASNACDIQVRCLEREMVSHEPWHTLDLACGRERRTEGFFRS